MQFKEQFIKEVEKRIEENIGLIESCFNLNNNILIKDKLYNLKPLKHTLTVLEEDDPYTFLNMLVYSIINKQNVKVFSNSIICDLLLELVNLVLLEFKMERIDKIV